jgi:hypothetical protein
MFQRRLWSYGAPNDAAFRLADTKGPSMAMKPNYRQERATRDRAKEAKKQEKLRRREEDSAKRKALREEQAKSAPEPDKT